MSELDAGQAFSDTLVEGLDTSLHGTAKADW
jgi:hypothetical protein